MRALSGWLRRVPGLPQIVRSLRARFRRDSDGAFSTSTAYWRERYAHGGNSGAGSYGKFAEFKARIINALFADLNIRSAIEFGCGDGNQLMLLEVREYLGIDVSAEAIERCRRLFEGKLGRRFLHADDYSGELAECALSLDVIYHLVEDPVFDAYMRRLFAAATRCVVIYSSDCEKADLDGEHVRHRRFTEWVERHQTGWKLERRIANDFPFRGDWREGSFADFYVYLPKHA